MAVPGVVAVLRRCALAASVLHDVDLAPGDDGVVLPLDPPLLVGWAELAAALDGLDGESPEAPTRLARWLTARRALATGAEPLPLGLPRGHALHPGAGWPRHRVLGGALDVGLGLAPEPAHPARVLPLPPGLAAVAGLDAARAWRRARGRLERCGDVAAELLRSAGAGPLRPVGGCDVVTLLAAAAFRAALAAPAGGMRPVAVPMRERGWVDLSRVDPAFAVAAAAATAPDDRGFERPVLVTRDEVTLPPPGGRPARDVLREAVPRPR